MSLFGVLRLRLSQETAPNSAQDDEFNYENNFRDSAPGALEDMNVNSGGPTTFLWIKRFFGLCGELW